MSRPNPAHSAPATLLSRRAASAVAGGSLAVGFAVAQGTDVRALGGLLLLAGLGLCVPTWARRSGARVAAALLALYAVLFALSHVLTLQVGLPAWVSVVAVSVAQTWASYALDRPGPAPAT